MAWAQARCNDVFGYQHKTFRVMTTSTQVKLATIISCTRIHVNGAMSCIPYNLDTTVLCAEAGCECV